MTTDTLPKAFSVAQVARKYGCDRGTVYDAIKSGALRAGRVGRRYLVLPEAVVEWLSRVKP